MMIWQPATFSILRRDGWREVSGWLWDIWAVRDAGCFMRDPFAGDEAGDEGEGEPVWFPRWEVTHLPSGQLVSAEWGYRSRAHAERLVELLTPLWNWDQGGVVQMPRAVRKRARGMKYVPGMEYRPEIAGVR